MKKLTKLTAAILALMLGTATLTACGEAEAATVSASPSPASSSTTASESATAPHYRIGITQLMEHKSLDAAYKGFVDGLAELGYRDGENITLDYQNAQGEQINCNTIAQKLVQDKCDLILAIATPAAQAAANLTKDIPIIVSAVTDPAAAKLVASNEAPGGNVTGASDLAPIEAQIELIQKLLPEAKTVGMLYSSSEDNSVYQIGLAKAACDKLGLSYVEGTVATMSDVQMTVQYLTTKCDVIYTPTDNLIASSMPAVSSVATPAGIPVVTGAQAMAEEGGLASLSVDYYELGKLSAQQAIDILVNGKQPATIPVAYQQNPAVYINKANAEALGLTIPAELG